MDVDAAARDAGTPHPTTVQRERGMMRMEAQLIAQSERSLRADVGFGLISSRQWTHFPDSTHRDERGTLPTIHCLCILTGTSRILTGCALHRGSERKHENDGAVRHDCRTGRSKWNKATIS